MHQEKSGFPVCDALTRFDQSSHQMTQSSPIQYREDNLWAVRSPLGLFLALEFELFLLFLPLSPPLAELLGNRLRELCYRSRQGRLVLPE